jgi:predicted extracellular nuclease
VAVRLRWLALALGALVLMLGVQQAQSAPTELFFSEYVEGSSFNKALEIYNGTGVPVDLGALGYSVFFSFNGGTATRTIGLTGTVANGDVYVIAQATADPVILAQADQTDTSTSWFNGDDFVALRKNGVTVDGIGQLGFDPGTEWGTGNTSTADNTIRRKPTVQAGDTTEGDAFVPATEWDGFANNTFDGLGSHTITTGGDAAPAVASTVPANGASEVPVGSNVTINFSEPVSVAAGWYSISCGSSGLHTATQSGGPQSFTLDPDSDFVQGESCTVSTDATKVTDLDTDDPPNQMASNHSFSFTTTLPLTQIGQVQATSHLSPYNGQLVKVEGVVIAERGSNVWIQDTTPDADPATSEAILVFSSSVASAVAVGDLVHARGTVTEFRAGCSPSCAPSASAFDNLTITELASPGVGATNFGPAPLPPATVIGAGGRVPPTEVIENDAAGGNVETSGAFDPAQDGIDFYETLEHMLVQVNNPVVVGPRNNFGEILVLADDGAGAGIRTSRGGIVIRDVDPSSSLDYSNGDFNPERIMLDDLFLSTPNVDVADHFTTSAVGLMTYDFANFKIAVTRALTATARSLEQEVTVAPRENELAIATFNVENLDPSDAPTIPRLARIVVDNMRSPDLIGIEEMQDNTGGANDGTTAANLSWQAFIDAIVAAGGPRYDYRQIDPQNNQDGGQPGGNIRVGFLFRTDRGLRFVDRPGGDATTPTGVFRADGKAHLTLSPGRVDPLNPAWEATRKPLAGEFVWNDKTFIAIVNHFSSKGGDDPLFGRFQPPIRSSEVARHQQAASVNAFVDKILDAERKANVVVLGDINDFEFSETTRILVDGGVLTSLMDTLPKPERYSYVFEGNSQVLDQILFSANMMRGLNAYDVVHVNAEFFDQASDHDPSVARTMVLGGGGGG